MQIANEGLQCVLLVLFLGVGVCLTVGAKHSVLGIMRERNTCGFQLLNESLIEGGGLHSTAIQNGLKQNKPLRF